MSFVSEMTPWAKRAAAKIHGQVHWQAILDQWDLETGGGSSSLAKRAHNYAGIKYTNHADFKSGAYSGYNSIAHFVNDYARVMNLSYYSKVRAPGSVEQDIQALDASPWATDPNYGKKLESINSHLNLPSGSGGTASAGNWLDGLSSQLKGMSDSEVQKYAVMGLGVVLLLGLKG